MKHIPVDFQLICKKVFDAMAKGDVLFSTDAYHANSIKGIEHQRRGASERMIIQGVTTKSPPE